jgi:peptide/nickel transport system permease protein
MTRPTLRSWHGRRPWLRRMLRDSSLMLGLVMFVALLATMSIGPLLWPVSATDMDFARILQAPSPNAPFGTDELGRDVVARVLHGGRTSLAVGAQVMIITTILGTAIGLATGINRTTDAVLMRFTDVFMAFPALLLALAILAALGNRPFNVVIALSLVYAPRTARLLRGQVLYLVEMTYVEASRAAGARRWHTLLRHVLPGLIPTLIVQETFLFAYAMLGEAGLSFVGVGIQPPLPSWGNILGDARVFIREAPWMLLFPGAAISLTVLSLNLLGDGLQKVLDPKRSAL